MATYTNLGIQQITTGAEAGTWGTVTNTNFDYFDTSIVGNVDVTFTTPGTTGTPNALNVQDYAVSDGRNRAIRFIDGGTSLAATCYVRITKNGITTAPYFAGYYFVRNSLTTSSLVIFLGTYNASTNPGVTVPNGTDAIIKCVGGIASVLYTKPVFTGLTVDGATTVTGDIVAGTLSAGTTPISSYLLSVDSGATLSAAYIKSTDAGAGGINFVFFKDSATPAASDAIASFRFYGNNSVAASIEYVRLTADIADTTSASEDGTFKIYTYKAGSLGERVRYSSADGFYLIDGAFRAPDVYASTTATSANMVMAASTGILQRSTSSLRYKNSIADATYGLTEVMQLRAVTFKGNADGDTVFGGFIAEEIDAVAKLKPFVVYDAEGRPDALNYGSMVSLIAKAIQEQQAVIEDLKARLTALGG